MKTRPTDISSLSIVTNKDMWMSSLSAAEEEELKKRDAAMTRHDDWRPNTWRTNIAMTLCQEYDMGSIYRHRGREDVAKLVASYIILSIKCCVSCVVLRCSVPCFHPSSLNSFI